MGSWEKPLDAGATHAKAKPFWIWSRPPGWVGDLLTHCAEFRTLPNMCHLNSRALSIVRQASPGTWPLDWPLRSRTSFLGCAFFMVVQNNWLASGLKLLIGGCFARSVHVASTCQKSVAFSVLPPCSPSFLSLLWRPLPLVLWTMHLTKAPSQPSPSPASASSCQNATSGQKLIETLIQLLPRA